jgi:cytochrome bd-type quinol oxidase subunit 1
VIPLIALLKQEASRTTQRITRKLVAAIVAGVFLAAAMAFAVAAFYLWLAAELGAIAACLIIAGVFLVLASIAVAILARREAPRTIVLQAPQTAAQAVPPTQAGPSTRATQTAPDPLQAASSLLDAVASPKLSTVLQLAAAGLVLGIAAGRRVTRK